MNVSKTLPKIEWQEKFELTCVYVHVCIYVYEAIKSIRLKHEKPDTRSNKLQVFGMKKFSWHLSEKREADIEQNFRFAFKLMQIWKIDFPFSWKA